METIKIVEHDGILFDMSLHVATHGKKHAATATNTHTHTHLNKFPWESIRRVALCLWVFGDICV